MPLVDDNPVGGFTQPVYAPEEPATPSFTQTWGAAFRLENDVLNAYDFLKGPPTFTPNADFNVGKRLRELDVEKRTNIWENYRDNFLGVRSEEEMNYVLGKLNQEQKDRETQEQAGLGGLVASVAAGTLSPTMLMPFIGQARGIRGIATAALWGGAAGVAQEVPLQLQQETRTIGESAFAIGAGTVIGGVLGAAVQALRPGELAKLTDTLEREAVGMGATPMVGTIPSSVGAAAAPGLEYAGRLQAARVSKIADWLGPVTRVINQQYNRTMSWGMSQLADAGLRLEGNLDNIATSVGGTVESRIKTYYGGYGQVAEGLDDAYAKYIFGENNVPGLAPNIRASLSGVLNKDQLTRAEFRAEIGKAMREGDQHPIPEVAQSAALVREKIFTPILREAQIAGVFGDVKVKGDESYLTRIYNHEIIAANTQEFIETLAREFAKKLDTDFGEKLAKLKETERRSATLIEDLVRPADEVEMERAKLQAELLKIDADRAPNIVAAEDRMADLRRQARALRDKPGAEAELARRNLLAEARDIQRSIGDEGAAVRAQRSEARRRLQGLARAQVALEARQFKKLERIEKIEDTMKRELERVARVGRRVLNRLAQFTDKEMDAEIAGLKEQFADLAARFDAGEERIAKMAEGEAPDQLRLLALEETQANRSGRLSDITDEIEALENVDRAAVREGIQSALDRTIQRATNLNERRLAREARLIEQAQALDPAQVSKRIEDVRKRTGMSRIEFAEWARERGINDIDLDRNADQFMEYARVRATEVKDKIMGTNVRVPITDVMQGARGPELARVLDIPSNSIAKFLENDVEKIVRTYLRSLPPDIEIAKKFGDINGTKLFEDATVELNDRLAELGERAKAENWPDKKLEKETAALNKEFAATHRDLEVVIGRLRNTWGLPDNPDGMAYRMGRMVLNLNVLRLMGGTLISSIPDVARPIQKYGLTRTFRDGFVPMVNNWKQLQVSAREAKLAGAALDAIMHTRAQAVHDILDDYGRHSKFERAVDFATNKMGAVALFDYWTTAMKQLSASVIIGKLSDSIDIVAGGAKASAKDIAEAQTFLASKGLTGKVLEDIYADMLRPGGSDLVNGVRMPNTEAWSSESQRAFRSALASEVDNTIITPGVERPVWMDASMTGRLIGQFKSFGMSSTHKVLLAGLQQRDMAFLSGTMVSLALGALSYYLYAMAAGGQTKEKMLKAGVGKFADEAINRSGLLGVFSEGQRFFERIPATQRYASFSGDRTTRRGGDDIVDVFLGPSFGAGKTAAKVLAGIDDPTKSTLHNFRTLLPWQNVVYSRQLLDAVERSVDLPERRD